MKGGNVKNKIEVVKKNTGLGQVEGHEVRRYAHIYASIHDVAYHDLIAIALRNYIDINKLQTEVVSFLKKRNLSVKWGDKLLNERK